MHTVEGTSANLADVAQARTLLHGEEKAVFADAGYQGVEKRPEIAARFGGVRFEVAAKRGKIKAMAEGRRKELTVASSGARRNCARRWTGQEHGASPHPLCLGQSGYRQTLLLTQS